MRQKRAMERSGAEGEFLKKQMKRALLFERHFHESENSALDQISLLSTTHILSYLHIIM